MPSFWNKFNWKILTKSDKPFEKISNFVFFFLFFFRLPKNAYHSCKRDNLFDSFLQTISYWVGWRGKMLQCLQCCRFCRFSNVTELVIAGKHWWVHFKRSNESLLFSWWGYSTLWLILVKFLMVLRTTNNIIYSDSQH